QQDRQQQAGEQAQMQQQIAQMEAIVKQHLSKDAVIRYGGIKAADPEKAVQILLILLQLIQSGRITEKVDDQAFKKLLMQMAPKKREIRISKS
ncbi:hypothetical protein HYU10_02355, partial [Candidatus Woesearchaeota archaeon]|nr:hypothetical protein [Candidatus Woesearchaeota archaeon]